MTRHVLTGRYFDTIKMTAANESWVIDASAVVAAANGAGIQCDNDLVGNTITIAGTVTGEQAAIFSGAGRTELTITGTGTVIGLVDFGGSGSRISNAGHIVSTDMGIGAEGGGIKLANSGTIDAATIGVFADALQGDFVNGRTGVISGGQYALELHGDPGFAQRVVNQGRLSGGVLAIDAENADDTIVNTGRIVGDVDLGGGNDVFDARDGVLKGRIVSGTGSDTLITDNARVHLTEDALGGGDQVRSSVSYKLNAHVEHLQLIGSKDIDGTGKHSLDSLFGNVGDNVLRGLGGPDILDGGNGNDRLIGGAGNDTFGFATKYGKDEIVDFAAGDKVYVHNWSAVGNFNQLLNHVENHGSDVWIKAGGDTLIIDHLHKADLQPGDFLF